jgi:hypothetical protein
MLTGIVQSCVYGLVHDFKIGVVFFFFQNSITDALLLAVRKEQNNNRVLLTFTFCLLLSLCVLCLISVRFLKLS